MGDYFKSWRRKLGVVTLAMACAFVAMWTRSPFISDCVSIGCYGAGTEREQGLFSMNNHLVWMKMRASQEEDCGLIPDFPAPALPKFGFIPNTAILTMFQGIEWSPQWRFFSIGSTVINDPAPAGGLPITIRRRFFRVHFLYVVLPLTLLSLYLLLSQPRVAKPKPLNEKLVAD